MRIDLTEKSTHEFFENASREYHRDRDCEHDSYEREQESYDGDRDYGD